MSSATNQNNPLAIVTGASSGIGYELAAQFAQHGFDLCICAEDDGITQASADLEVLGVQVESVQCDLSIPDGVEEFFAMIQSLGRPIAAAAINAGVGVNGRFFETDWRAELNMINLNAVSATYLAKFIVKDMVQRRQGGRILFTSSIVATAPGPYEAVYSATKAYLYYLSESLRQELEEYGITVTALMPGPTDTHFFRRAGMEDTKLGVEKKDDPEQVARQSFEALMAGKDHVNAGSLKTHTKNMANDLIPEPMKAKQQGKMSKPGSATS